MKKILSVLLALVFAVGLISPLATTAAYASTGVVMTVNGTEYTDHGTGWSAALELADDDIETTVKLFADWVAPNGNFESELGTDNGSLHIDGSDFVLTIDLNGHKIDRNLSSPVDDGCGRVFHVQNVKSLTICDTKGGGLITGANNAGGLYDGRGGAFLIEDGEIVFDNITIAGNKSQSQGGAMYVWYDDTTVEIKNCIIRDNEANTGGGIFAYDDVAVTISDTTICNNIALGHGGGICWRSKGPLQLIENVNFCHNEARGENSEGGDGGAIYGSTVMVDMFKYTGGPVVVYDDSVKIFENKAKFGAGISWASTGDLVLLGGVITGNFASECGGGVIMHKDIGYVGGHMQHFGNLYLGGTVKILGNTTGDVADNVYIEGALGKLCHASDMSVEAYNVPLSEGACIGVGGPEELLINTGLTNGEAKFYMDSYRYFFADNDDYYLRPVYNKNSDNNKYKFVYTARDSDIYEATEIDITEYNEELLTGVSVDDEENIITMTARNNKKHTFESFTLDFLIAYDRDVFNIQNIERACNLLEPQKYVIFGQNGTYEIFTVQVVPEGGEWSDFQDEPVEYFYAHVSAGDTLAKFKSCEEGWAYAVQQASEGIPVTFKLMNDWVEEKGDFIGGGTELGYLYLNDEDIDLTIELNGYTIDRNLDTAKENGQVFKIDDGKLTITDSVGTGKITGGNTKGYGGAFLVEYGTLRIKGGEIKDNKAEYGGAIYCDDLDDAFIYIEGGKFVGNQATEDGGAIYIFNGYLDISGGEISGNTAKNGAGVYWESKNRAYLTGGRIINNNATVSGGVFVEDYGDVYVGADILITGNGNGNLYLYNGACISNAAGQEEKIPNKPLSEAARIGISTNEKEELISEDNSMFNEADFDVIFSDNSGYFIRSVYDAEDEGHEHKLYINSWGHEDSRYPRVKTVSVKNSDIVEDATIDYDEQIITLKVSVDNKDALKSVALNNLISYTCDKDIYYIDGADKNRDLTTVQKYKTISDNGTYVMVIVEVEWICTEHSDADDDGLCDECNEYTLTEFTITEYNAQTQEAIIFAPQAGTYKIVFADYENGFLEDTDVAEYEFEEGFNLVPQTNTRLMLGKDDKVMLWQVSTNFVPVCDGLTLK